VVHARRKLEFCLLCVEHALRLRLVGAAASKLRLFACSQE
jgi:hypothetical protein